MDISENPCSTKVNNFVYFVENFWKTHLFFVYPQFNFLLWITFFLIVSYFFHKIQNLWKNQSNHAKIMKYVV